MSSEMDSQLPEWIDRHSVTCHCCGGLADERETSMLTEECGEICPTCTEAITLAIDKANKCLESYTSDPMPEYTITELACRLVVAQKEIDIANETIERVYRGK